MLNQEQATALGHKLLSELLGGEPSYFQGVYACRCTPFEEYERRLSSQSGRREVVVGGLTGLTWTKAEMADTVLLPLGYTVLDLGDGWAIAWGGTLGKL